MGGGRKYMFPKNQPDVEYPSIGKHNGTRKDGRNLVQEWTERTKDKVCFSSPPASLVFPRTLLPSQLHLHTHLHTHVIIQTFCSFFLFLYIYFFNVQKGHYVWNKQQLLSLNPNNVDHLLGEFAAAECHYKTPIEV